MDLLPGCEASGARPVLLRCLNSFLKYRNPPKSSWRPAPFSLNDEGSSFPPLPEKSCLSCIFLITELVTRAKYSLSGALLILWKFLSLVILGMWLFKAECVATVPVF